MSELGEGALETKLRRRYKYLQVYVDRLGKKRVYFRPPQSKAQPLPSIVGSPEFEDEYQTALTAYLAGKGSGSSQIKPSALAVKRRLEVERQIWGPDRPPECGVYLLLEGQAVVYVGSSSNVPLRVLKHRQNGRPFERALAIAVPMDDLLWVERMLIAALKPAQNRAYLPSDQ